MGRDDTLRELLELVPRLLEATGSSKSKVLQGKVEAAFAGLPLARHAVKVKLGRDPVSGEAV